MAVDNLTSAQWRELGVGLLLDLLGCCSKLDPSFLTVQVKGTKRNYANVQGVDNELTSTGSSFSDTRTRRSSGGAVDLAMHLYCVDFIAAVLRLRRVL